MPIDPTLAVNAEARWLQIGLTLRSLLKHVLVCVLTEEYLD